MKLPVDYTAIHYTQRRVVREEYIKRQHGKCYHCGNAFKDNPAAFVLKKTVNKKLFPKGFFNWPIHLHHNHITGMTIGAVHSYCNAVLWEYHGE